MRFFWALIVVICITLVAYTTIDKMNLFDKKVSADSEKSTPAERISLIDPEEANEDSTFTEENEVVDSSKSEMVNSSKMAVTSDAAVPDAAVKATLAGNVRDLPLFGFNGETTRSPSWSNSAFRDSTASLHLKVIRYPGGGVSNFWDWRKGWFVDKAPENLQGVEELRTYKYTDPRGLNDLKLLVNETGCDVVFVLNMVTKDLNDQLAMLQAAQSLGIPVKWLELGNEFYLPKSPGKQKFATPAIYGEAAEQWITAIKKSFPNVKTAVIGTGAQAWNDAVLKNAPSADAIVAHVYPTPNSVIDETGISFSKLYNALTKKDQNFKVGVKKIPVWVTEYNIHWAATIKGLDKSEKSKIQNYAFSWAQALATIMMTSNAATLTNNVPIVLNHDIGNWNNFAALDVQKKTFKKLPSGMGMELWLKASDGMTTMQKIDINSMQEYEALGWKFSNPNTSKSAFLITNFTDSPVTVDLSSVLQNSASLNYRIESADKNAPINGWKDVHIQTGEMQNNTLQLPAYGIATISQ